MKPLMMAALVVQLMSAGGAKGGQARGESKAGDSLEDVSRNFSALKNEVTSLSEQFQQARERARREAERKKKESEAFYDPHPQQAAPSTGASAH